VVTAFLYEAEVGHRRLERLDQSFTHRLYLWLVDLDDLPRLPAPLRPLARFDPADHIGDPHRSIRENLDAFLAARGVARPASVLMLAHARVLGYVFNPITLYWCRDDAGALTAVVAEVHNTYGGRHHYLLETDAQGRARVDKDFYVSPFFPVDGGYLMRFSGPGERLRVTIALRRAGGTPFTARLEGTARPATAAGVAQITLRRPLMALQAAALIRYQGVRLWLRRLPVVPLPVHHPPAGV
jgi:DUF1365 family protein